ncbi:hypothetical protein CYMTET_10902 [Cymbomonas tetramitiformis]|uniref:Protein kinase domain-containing protein n=1 Tax=Cymbomonas tetramitiformis TaxID=36881 RepID=A0AAE0LE04_9CHLO|nr:hypothetical protein CYMTET_10902 [Cymbomonas tetramitiformis]
MDIAITSYDRTKIMKILSKGYTMVFELKRAPTCAGCRSVLALTTRPPLRRSRRRVKGFAPRRALGARASLPANAQAAGKLVKELADDTWRELQLPLSMPAAGGSPMEAAGAIVPSEVYAALAQLPEEAAAAAAALTAAPPELQAAVRAWTLAASEADLSSVPWSVWGTAVVVAGMAAGGFAGANARGAREEGMDEWARLAQTVGEQEPEELKQYSPEAAQEYFKKRPLVLLRRALRSITLLGSFSTSLYLDSKMNRRPEDDEAMRNRTDSTRAEQLRALLVRLGPTYVKLGQVLSSRQDLLPAPYIERLRTLQDAVPPFDDAAARRILSDELGPSVAAQLALSERPLASASLGQVYRATWKGATGPQTVAVKVQRPGALSAISLDIAIIRFFSPTLYKINEPKGNLDVVGLIDEWGLRFIDELDYGLEAGNGEAFSALIASRSDLGPVVMSPAVVRQASGRRVLTTEWVDGCRLDESNEGDVGRLCAVALSTYLCMLLDLGTLHVDPHPGNLLRTSDGRLCILDWGLVTTVTPAQSDAILQFIAHLVSKDFSKVDADLSAMGFVPPEKLAALADDGLSSSIATIFSALAAGGGAAGFRSELGLPPEEELKELRKKIRKIKDREERKAAFIEAAGGSQSKVATLSRDLEDVQKKYGNVFTIPAYFGYILRAFSVLEGIGLAQDPNYSIANECYPFVARRLLTDRSPSNKRALEQLLYGAQGPKARLSVERVQQLSEAFQTYTQTTQTAGSPAAAGNGKGSSHAAESQGIPAATKEALRLMLAPEGGPLQDIVLREVARFSGAAMVDTVERAVGEAFAENSLLYQQNALVQNLGPARVFLAPFPTPYELYDGLIPRKSADDESTLEVAAALTEALAGSAATAVESGVEAPGLPAGMDPDDLLQDPQAAAAMLLSSLPSEELAQEIMELLPELAPGAQAAALRLAALLLEQSAARLGEPEKGRAFLQ